MRKVCSILIPVVMMIVGCRSDGGPPMAEVTGKLTFKGQPVQGGVITFFQAGRPYLAEIKADGTYKSAVAIGPCQVTVVWRETMPNNVPIHEKKADGGKNFIPEIYNHAHKSPLSFEVKAGTNRADFELK